MAPGIRGTVLVTDGEQRAALASVRSLGRAGYGVYVCAPRVPSLAGVSRYCRGEFLAPDPLRAPGEFAARVAELAGQVAATVVLPIAEPAVLALLPARDTVPAIIPFPPLASFERLSDKAHLLERAPAHGIRVPRQFELRAPSDASALDSSWHFPVVLKPSRSVVGSPGAREKVSVSYATDASALHKAIAELPIATFPVLLQERVRGPGCAISLLIWDGQVRAAFAHRRLREKPPSGGVSVLRESIPLDPTLLAQSVALLGDFDWRGVAMVEFKVDQATGVPFLMEVNGRLWGSVQLAIDAGVDFPTLLVDAAVGIHKPAVTEYRAGVRTWWEWGDVDHLVARLRHSAVRLALPEGSPGRFRAVGDLVRTVISTSRREVFRLDDLKPFMLESLDWFRRR